MLLDYTLIITEIRIFITKTADDHVLPWQSDSRSSGNSRQGPACEVQIARTLQTTDQNEYLFRLMPAELVSFLENRRP
jgi:hypothetical protein